MMRRWIAVALCVLPVAASAASPDALEGHLRAVDARSLFEAPGAPAGWAMLSSAESGLGVDASPGMLILATDQGMLYAVPDDPPVRYTAQRRDPRSFRTLRIDAPADADCPTGAETWCWRSGDPLSFDRRVADAIVGAAAPAALVTPEGGLAINADLRGAEGSVLLQSFPGFPGAVVGARWSDGRMEIVPGARGPGDPDFDPDSDGGSSGDVQQPHVFEPQSGLSFQSEMAAASWNFLMTLVAFSSVPSPIDASRDGPDPDQIAPDDPMSRAPGQCSFAQPQYCGVVQSFFALPVRSALYWNPPRGEPFALRFTWERGAEYRVLFADGDLAPYHGGRVHVMAVERSRVRSATHGVPLVLFPAEGTSLAASDAFAVAPAGEDTAPHGFAYLSAPEPAAFLAAATALAALAIRRARPRS